MVSSGLVRLGENQGRMSKSKKEWRIWRWKPMGLVLRIYVLVSSFCYYGSLYFIRYMFSFLFYMNSIPLNNEWNKLKLFNIKYIVYYLTRDEVIERVTHTWNEIRGESVLIQNLFQSLPKRMKAVMNSECQPTKY
jgi:hypothetical protein